MLSNDEMVTLAMLHGARVSLYSDKGIYYLRDLTSYVCEVHPVEAWYSDVLRQYGYFDRKYFVSELEAYQVYCIYYDLDASTKEETPPDDHFIIDRPARALYATRGYQHARGPVCSLARSEEANRGPAQGGACAHRQRA